MSLALFSDTECVDILTCHEHDPHDAPSSACNNAQCNSGVMSCEELSKESSDQNTAALFSEIKGARVSLLLYFTECTRTSSA